MVVSVLTDLASKIHFRAILFKSDFSKNHFFDKKVKFRLKTRFSSEKIGFHENLGKLKYFQQKKKLVKNLVEENVW